MEEVDLSTCPDGLHRIVVRGRRAIAKVRRGAPADFFAAEARGLAALARSGSLRVPEILCSGAASIVIEDLGAGQPAARDWENAGSQLAALHRVAGGQFGFAADGYCGDTPQANPWTGDGWRFFAECRLLPQGWRAFESERLERRHLHRIEALCTRLPDLLPQRAPVLTHGDLWSGNLHACANGELALIDGGAVHYGWAECDLAMLTLFGEPPRPFFAAYEHAAGVDAGWRERAPLLNLYHLLNHLNLFGASYLDAVQAVLARYA